MKKNTMILLGSGMIALFLLCGLSFLRFYLNGNGNQEKLGSYHALKPADTKENPLEYISEDFYVKSGFHTNLPILILSLDGDVPEYKEFSDGNELLYSDTNPYTTGRIELIDCGTDNNCLEDKVVASSDIQIKKRGHTSYMFDKPQYLIKTVSANGCDRSMDLLGMGEGDSFVLNGSMADKSMIRNYLSYRIASEIDGNGMSPDSRFCEVLLKKEDGYIYQGLYLLMETISRGDARVSIDEYNKKNSYSSYIVRRDRFTQFDPMLETYGRMNGYAEQWIGLKYPSAKKISENEAVRKYIEDDFSNIEKVIYSDKESVFKTYDKYIDIDYFVDYFLINEYFGNYDAGIHSTYMYKNSGDLLRIGPVWDFDQAMNNYYQDEMETETIAFQTQPLFDRLTKDRRFIDKLKDRYSELQNEELSEEHVFAVIDEATAYIAQARQREWYRYRADYEDGSGKNIHNYYLKNYMENGMLIKRFNKDYDQEIYNIKNYLHKHSLIISTELTKLYKLTKFNSSIKNENELFLVIILSLFFVPSLLLNRKN